MPNAENIVLGRADVSLAPWVTDGGAGSFVALGHIKGPVTIETAYENYEVKSEQQLGPLAAQPVGVGFKIKFVMMEALLKNYQAALRQLDAQHTGISPNFIFAVDDPVEIYHQVKLVGKPIRSALAALGPNPGTRTILGWRCIMEATAPQVLTKSSEQIIDVTLNVMYDESIALPLTKGSYYNLTDTAVA